MHKRSQTSMMGFNLDLSNNDTELKSSSKLQPNNTKLNKDLVDKMVQKYFNYVDRVNKGKFEENPDELSSDDDFFFSEITEGKIIAPPQTHVKIPGMEHHNNNPISQKIQTLKVHPGISKSNKSPLRKIKAKKIKAIIPSKQKKYTLNIRKISHRPVQSGIPLESSTDQFLKEMVKHGLDKEISKICSRKVSEEKIPRNDTLKPIGLENNSTQSTSNSNGENSTLNNNGRQFIFPYQRRNRSCSPENIELSISGLSKTPSIMGSFNSSPKSGGPVIAKNFMFGPQVKPPHQMKNKEGMQVLRAISKSQERAGEKQCIIEDLDDELMIDIEDQVKEQKPEVIPEKEIIKPEPVKTIKPSGRGRHRRVTSQVIDKQELMSLLTENKGMFD